MDEQLTFEFAERTTIKGFPELRWTGKRPYRSTQYYPAQLRERYGEERDGWINKIFWGDNLQVMSHLLKEYRGKIDLVYIDPPFDSKADYKRKIALKGIGNTTSDATSFEEKQYGDIWTNDEYLQFMYERLMILRELMSDTASIFVHCDWHKVHHLRCLMDEIFGSNMFLNEIVWQRTRAAHSDATYFGKVHDTILVYKKGGQAKFNPLYTEHSEAYLKRFTKEENGRKYMLVPLHGPGQGVARNFFGKIIAPPAGRCWPVQSKIDELIAQNRVELTSNGTPSKKSYLDENNGNPVSDWWDDIVPLNPVASERTDYPTQKPEQLLERIVEAATNRGDLVFDCFMGSGTTQSVAMKLGRRFIGADINLGAIQTTTKRLINVASELDGQLQEEIKYTGFEVYNVNNYDFFRNPIEAKNLIIEALEVQPFTQGNVWDGELDGRMVKIMPVNRIATKADLEELKANLPYKTYEKRKEENPRQPVELITIICMGHEPDLKASLEQSLSEYKVDVQIVDILRDKSELQLKREAEAEVVREGNKLVIRSFYPMNLMQKLSLQKEYVEDWKQLVESIMIDWNYDGVVMQPMVTDVPDKKEFVAGIYDIPEDVYGDDDDSDVWNDATLMDNQRFKKLCRLPQLGVYVDEAHHLFGANLEKELRSGGANKTTLRNTINMLAEATSIVACYNYTGTPYVKRQVLPEVVYAYGLRDSISHGFLKDADPIGFDNVKNEEFLKKSITMFWERYGGKTYEGLPPKMAIFAASVAEATDVVRPAVEKILSELNVSLDTILVNTGDTTVTKNDDIRDFNNLDVLGTEGSRKQFIILVEKGREGWNCRSLLGIALFRSPKSKIFVLQATMRCLRKLTDEQLKATVFLSKENLDTLDEELRNNYNMEIKDLGQSSDKKKNSYKVRVLPPPRSIKMKRIWHEYSLIEKEYSEPIDFKVSEIDDAKYESKMYEKGSIRLELSTKETVIDDIKDQMRYSRFSLVGEISRYMNLSCVLISRILSEAIDGFDNLVEVVNKHNEVLDDVIIPKIFNTLYEVKSEQKNEDVDVILLKEPKDSGYYEFSADENLVIEKDHNSFTPEEIKKSFHADTYCFDSKPEKECFLQYISSKKVKEIYFTGMFTANQGDLFVQYYDPESKRIRQYYPDFLAKMNDGSYQLIEVKGDNMIDDEVVKAKAEAAEEMSVASGMKYVMYAGSVLMKQNVLEHPPVTYSEEPSPLLMVAEDPVPYGK